MLRSLHIENVAVIRRLDIEFGAGFSVLTGETGAGKSIIIDSLNVLLGNRVSRELIRTGESTATVSAVFDELSDAACDTLAEMGFCCEDRSIMLQRTLDTQGRSKTRLDGQVITQSVVTCLAFIFKRTVLIKKAGRFYPTPPCFVAILQFRFFILQ